MAQEKRETEKRELMRLEHVSKHFRMEQRKWLKAVDDVSLTIYEGETLGLVGESGCGKSTLGRTILRLYEPTSGKIFFQGEDICRLKGKELRRFKKQAQIIFQDPYASLNPRMTIQDIIEEGLKVHAPLDAKGRQEKVLSLMREIGLSQDFANRYAHELSGGQRQRVGIARALAVDPRFVVCDEPISALDVSIQAQILNLLIELQKEYGLTYLFISHDLSMVRYISDRIGVMYLGSLVELCDKKRLYEKPLHPYTKALLSAIPAADPHDTSMKNRVKLEGEIPSPMSLPAGCRFQNRCRYCTDRCRRESPVLRELEPGHFAACHRAEELIKED